MRVYIVMDNNHLLDDGDYYETPDGAYSTFEKALAGAKACNDQLLEYLERICEDRPEMIEPWYQELLLAYPIRILAYDLDNPTSVHEIMTDTYLYPELVKAKILKENRRKVLDT